MLAMKAIQCGTSNKIIIMFSWLRYGIMMRLPGLKTGLCEYMHMRMRTHARVVAHIHTHILAYV